MELCVEGGNELLEEYCQEKEYEALYGISELH
jgi:hypothetical protein